MAEQPKKGDRFKMDRLEERVTPSYFAPGCGGGSSHGSGKGGSKKGKGGSSKKGGSKKGKHGSSKKGGSKKGKHGSSKKGGSKKGGNRRHGRK